MDSQLDFPYIFKTSYPHWIQPIFFMELLLPSMLHRSCNREWPVTPGSLLIGQRCFHCFGSPKKSHEEFVREIEEVHNSEYKILTPYVSAHEQVLAKHKTCGYEWLVVANSLRKGHGCPNCTKSKGEIEVSRVLTKLEIQFTKEHTFES